MLTSMLYRPQKRLLDLTKFTRPRTWQARQKTAATARADTQTQAKAIATACPPDPVASPRGIG